MLALPEPVQKLWPMLIFVQSRSQVKVKVTGQSFCMSGKPLSQEINKPNMKALSQMVQKLWAMLKLSNQQTSQQTNKQTGQKQYVPAIAIRDMKS